VTSKQVNTIEEAAALPVGQDRPRLAMLTRGDATELQSRVHSMNPADFELLDEVRRFYERGGPTC
jgi:hypothetical protein